MRWSLQFVVIFIALSCVASSRGQGAPGRDAAALCHSNCSSVPAVYERWLDEDVRYIASPEERKAFLRLSTNEDRDRFVEEFWKRRDPTPDTVKNEFKEEHYRRIAYANEHFAADVAGFKTDRGRIYIVYGPPDRIDVLHSPEAAEHPAEIWHYVPRRTMNGKDLDFTFVDECGCNQYRLQAPLAQ